MNTIERASSKKVETTRVSLFDNQVVSDYVSVEEPLEIRIAAPRERRRPAGSRSDTHQVAVTMRTPGHDRELAAGFLFTEGIIASANDVEKIETTKCNVVTVFLNDDVELDLSALDRHSFVASSCGICGKKSIAAVRVKRRFTCLTDEPVLTASKIHGLATAMNGLQDNFHQTGGIHASALFNSDGDLLNIKEDVGRHNALDKVIGAEFLRGTLPLNDKILMVSGRASFELVQKAAHAGLAFVAAVGAPSSLAVQLAEECNMTLVGFVRDDRFNIYTGSRRVGPYG